MATPLTVTIARQFASGGSYLAHHLAAELGCRLVDRVLLERAADVLSLDEAELAQREERTQPWLSRLLDCFAVGSVDQPYLPPPPPQLTDERIFAVQSRIIRDVAGEGDCVILGRAAGHVLGPGPRRVRLFCHAPLTFRVQRAIAIYGCRDEAQARRLVEQSDRLRRQFIAQRLGTDWSDATSYELCVDTSRLPLDDLAAALARYVRRATAGMG